MRTRSLFLLPSLAFLLLLSSCGPKKGVTEEFLAGDWYALKGDVESYTFMLGDGSNEFTGVLHGRPVTTGTWKFDGDKLVLIFSDGSQVVHDFSISSDTLFINNKAEIYTRNAPLKYAHPEVSILEDLASDLSLKFSQPEAIEGGYKLIVSVPPAKDFTELKNSIEKIATYLSQNGYEKDSLYIYESCTRYVKDNNRVTLCSRSDPEDANSGSYIDVSSELLNSGQE